MNYATVNDVIALYRKLEPDELSKAESLIPIICSRLRAEADKVGKDLDAMVAADEDLAATAKSVTVDIVARSLMTPTSAGNLGPMTQMSESALGYSVSGSFLNPGGGLFIKKAELTALGLRRQKYGVIDFYGADQRNNDSLV